MAANPFTADSRGNVSLFADPGEYVLRVTVGSRVTNLPITVPIDPDEAAQDSDIVGGVVVTAALLKMWTSAEAYEPTLIVRNADGAALSADILWPDGSGGMFTADAVDADSGGVDAYHLTHLLSGKTVTQAAVTRDPATGAVTVKPELAVT